MATYEQPVFLFLKGKEGLSLDERGTWLQLYTRTVTLATICMSIASSVPGMKVDSESAVEVDVASPLPRVVASTTQIDLGVSISHPKITAQAGCL